MKTILALLFFGAILATAASASGPEMSLCWEDDEGCELGDSSHTDNLSYQPKTARVLMRAESGQSYTNNVCIAVQRFVKESYHPQMHLDLLFASDLSEGVEWQKASMGTLYSSAFYLNRSTSQDNSVIDGTDVQEVGKITFRPWIGDPGPMCAYWGVDFRYHATGYYKSGVVDGYVDEEWDCGGIEIDDGMSEDEVFNMQPDTETDMTDIYLAVTVAPDYDQDLIKDWEDNCVAVDNYGQQDSDSNGYGDACDADFDNVSPYVVNGADYLLLIDAWGCTVGQGCYDAQIDMDSDGVINGGDYLLFIPHWGQGLEGLRGSDYCD